MKVNIITIDHKKVKQHDEVDKCYKNQTKKLFRMMESININKTIVFILFVINQEEITLKTKSNPIILAQCHLTS